jgi:L-threonylcarbamoyladenylate synthase
MSIAEAARLILEGGLVAFPTETVYGLGGDATNERAVAAIFEAKGRPQFNPLISHVLGPDEAKRLVRWSDTADKLAARFWPGPLTLVLPRAKDSPIALLATAGLDTVAVRAPAHPMAQALIRAVGRPLAAPSANRSGAVSPTRAEHVAESLGDRVKMILDGGPCEVGLESTVLDLTTAPPTLLRPGGATREAIEAVIGPIALSDAIPSGDSARKSPGQLKSHYAPARPVRLNASTVAADEGLLAFGPDVPSGAPLTLNLSPGGELAEAAANLFAMLRALDQPGIGRIAVMPIPETGLGLAINDRLRRAAADDGTSRRR